MPSGDFYDLDFHAWALDQAARLRRLSQLRLPAAEDVDLELIANEVEDLGHEQRLQVEASLVKALTLVIEAAARPEGTGSPGWSTKLRACLEAAGDRATPSIGTLIDMGQIWHKARLRARRGLQLDGFGLPPLPQACPYELGTLVAWDRDLHTLVAALERDGLPQANPGGAETVQPGTAGPS